ncbi:sensor histidine kinase [Ectobacillus funiculus]|uniref:sensor histidine kinase n=1 Tax=Ectobacillus funiculus TaxID=137993 RepID=UPI00101DFEAB|nr:ATP-binding protein [Ectobacillus funiculus]
MKKPTLYMIFIALIACIATYFTYVISTYPLMGMKAQQIKEHHYTVTDVYPNGWAYIHGIRAGDHIVISDDRVDTIRTHGRVEKIRALLIERKGIYSSFFINYERAPISYLFYTFFPLVLFVLTLAIVLYVYRRFKETESVLLLSVFLLIVSMCYVSSEVSARFDRIGVYVMGLSLIMCPVVVSHFMYQIYREHSITLFSRIVLYTLYICAVLLSTISYILVCSFHISEEIYLFLFLLMSAAVAALIYKNCRGYKHVLNPAKLKLVFYTILFAFLPFCLFYALPKVLTGIVIVSAEYTACFLAFLPFAALYIVMNKELHDIDYMLKRMFYYALLSCFPALALILGFYVLHPASFEWLSYLRIYLLCWAIMASLLFIKEEADVGIESRLVFNKARYEASLLRFSKAGMSSTSANSIIDNLINEMKKVLFVKRVFKLEFLKTGQRFCLSEDDCEIDLVSLRETLIREEMVIGTVMRGKSGYFLLVGETPEIYTCMFISYKKDRVRFNHDDLVWLHTIALHTNVLLQSFVHVQEILREFERTRDEQGASSLLLSKLLFMVSEQEKESLSRDIHDTLLQELILIYQELGQGMAIDAARDQLIQQIQYIREECYRLRPPFLLQMGIVDGLQTLIENHRMKEQVLIEFASNLDTAERLGEWYTVHLYRIMQELLHNARKHAEANCIFISLYKKENRLLLVYEDDGVGMEMSCLANTKPKQHFGLVGIKERTQAMNGELSISSAPNEGMLIRIELPLPKKENTEENNYGNPSFDC